MSLRERTLAILTSMAGKEGELSSHTFLQKDPTLLPPNFLIQATETFSLHLISKESCKIRRGWPGG